MYNKSFLRLIPDISLFLDCVILTQSIFDYELPIVIDPFLILINTVFFSSLNFKISTGILQTLFLHYLFDLSPHCAQFLELLHLKPVEFSSDRDTRDNSHCVHFLGIQMHQSLFFLT